MTKPEPFESPCQLHPFREAETGLLASYDPVLLAHLLVGMLMRAMNWWVEQDEPGPEVMADHLLFVLGQGLPSSLLTGKGHGTL